MKRRHETPEEALLQSDRILFMLQVIVVLALLLILLVVPLRHRRARGRGSGSGDHSPTVASHHS